MKRDLAIAACGACPFASYSNPDTGRDPACKAAVYLDPEDREWSRPFGVREGGITIFPAPPPDWCPLRSGAVTIRVAPGDEGRDATEYRDSEEGEGGLSVAELLAWVELTRGEIFAAGLAEAPAAAGDVSAIDAMLDATHAPPMSDEQVQRILKKARGELPIGEGGKA